MTVGEDLDIELARDGEEACSLLERGSFDVVFADLKMPRKNGLEVLEKAKAEDPASEVVIVTGHGDVPTAVEAMKKGRPRRRTSRQETQITSPGFMVPANVERKRLKTKLGGS